MPNRPSRFAAGARAQGWAMLAVLVVGLGLGLATLSRPGPRHRIDETLDAKAFFGGETAAAVNHAMAHDLPIGDDLTAAGGVVRWMVFGSGGPQVTPGCHDWLYLTEELRPWPDAALHMQARADALRQIDKALAERGIALQVVLVPDKRRIETEGACGVPYATQARARYAAFMRMIGGLHVTDLLQTYEGIITPVYYRTDTHWNQDGAALAAAAIAAVVPPAGPERPFKTSFGPEEQRAGDLLRLMGLDHVPNWLRPDPDHERPATTAEASPPADTGGLLDEAPVPETVLIGSSYSVNGNFLGALEESLAAPVGQFAEAGGAFWLSARNYFRSPAFRETPPKLVIWEIPERVVPQPIEPEEAAFLKNWRSE